MAPGTRRPVGPRVGGSGPDDRDVRVHQDASDSLDDDAAAAVFGGDSNPPFGGGESDEDRRARLDARLRAAKALTTTARVQEAHRHAIEALDGRLGRVETLATEIHAHVVTSETMWGRELRVGAVRGPAWAVVLVVLVLAGGAVLGATDPMGWLPWGK